MKRILYCGRVTPTTKYYVDAFKACGIDLIIQLENIDIDQYDALLLPGGVDINPKYYHQDNKGSENIDDELDQIQFHTLDLFVQNKKPVLGICRGHQLINVYFHGTLNQDIPQKKNHVQPQLHVDNKNHILTKNGSFLNKIYKDEFNSNSSHHQAVEKVGDNLEVVGKCEDGVIEALQHKTLPIISVQFHPERMCLSLKKEDIVDGLDLINYFISTIKES